MKEDKFKIRYAIKLLSSIVIAVFNIVIQFIIPRALSVEDYGYYTYNLNVFASVVAIATLSTPSALIAKFSKRNDEIGLVYFYLKFYFLMVCFLNAGLITICILKGTENVFAGQTIMMIILALESSILLRLQTDSIGIFDAMAISRFPAIMQIFAKMTLAMVVVAFFVARKLTLKYFYIAQCVIIGIIVFIMLFAVLKEQRKRYPQKKDLGFKAYLKEYFIFCRPLIISGVFAHIVVVLMNWVLMNWGGSNEQAMFGAAWQLNTLVTYVFSPYAELSKREYAVIYDNKALLRKRYEQSLKMLMWVTCYFAIFIGGFSDIILPIIYGDKYSGASQITMLIMLYTIYQAWGQISGSLLLALERTKASAFLGFFGELLTFVLVFVFQVPNFIWKNGLGAIGIGLTYLVSNIIGVGATIYINAKILQISFWKNFGIQVIPISVCGILVLILKQVPTGFLKFNGIIDNILRLFIYGILYSLIIFIIIYMNPTFVGLNKDGVKSIITRFRKGKNENRNNDLS